MRRATLVRVSFEPFPNVPGGDEFAVGAPERASEVGVLSLRDSQPLLHVLCIVRISRQAIRRPPAVDDRSVERVGIDAGERLLTQHQGHRDLLVDAELLDHLHHAGQIGARFGHPEHLNRAVRRDLRHVRGDVGFTQWHGDLHG